MLMSIKSFPLNPIRLLRRLTHHFLHTVDTDWLKSRGLKLGERVYFGPEVIVDSYHCWLISIGDDCVFAPRVHILAHDASMKRHLKYTRIGRVNIGKKTFVGAGTIILPGVSIGHDVIIGAGSVVTRDIPDEVVAAGNPARVICTTAEFLRKHREQLGVRPVYTAKGHSIRGGITGDTQAAMYEALANGVGYVE
jgi:maltose O-acetyltransferase